MKKFFIITDFILAALMIVLAIVRVATEEYMLAVHNVLWAVMSVVLAGTFFKESKKEETPYKAKVTPKEIVNILRGLGVTVSTAESCTGGLVAKSITDIPGASEVFNYGFVTYSNEAKHTVLDVGYDVLEEYTAVSDATAIMMARGAMDKAGSAIGVAITGYAGGSAQGTDKDGLVWVAVVNARGYENTVAHHWKDCSRKQIREAALGVALDMILEAAMK
jgi:PncC family amidohydrolase